MWQYIAAAAVPYVIGALQKKPKKPSAPTPVALPDRSKYLDMILQSGFNTDSRMYDQASDQVRDQVNRALAQQGLAGSSVGAVASIEGQNRVAQSFIDEKLKRQQAAMAAVQTQDAMAANIQQGNSQAAYQYAQDAYNARLASQAGVQQGMGQIVNAGANAYYANNAKSTYDQRRAEDRAWLTSMYGGPAKATMPVAPVQMIPFQRSGMLSPNSSYGSYYAGLGDSPSGPYDAFYKGYGSNY